MSGKEQETQKVDDNGIDNLRGIGQKNQSNGSNLSQNEVFDLVKNKRRRYVIRYLFDHGRSSSLSDVAEYIAADENDISVQELSSSQRKRVYIGLYQCHLPKMDSLGVIAYDKNRGTIELQDSTSQLLPYLDVEKEEGAEDAERNGVVLVIAACIAGLVSLGTLGIGRPAAISATGWTLVSIAGIALIVGIQYLD